MRTLASTEPAVERITCRLYHCRRHNLYRHCEPVSRNRYRNECLAGVWRHRWSTGTGNYDISGGSLTCSVSLDVGGGRNTADTQQTVGLFTVEGASPTISVTALRVGGYDVTTTTNSGTLEFKLGSGVSAIGCTSVSLDAGGSNSETDLLVSVTGTPSGDILLVKNTGASAVVGSFDKLNGGSALEGASITLGGVPYTLTYMYDSVTKIKGTVRDGTYNDIALLPEPATIALLGLGLLLVRRNRK